MANVTETKEKPFNFGNSPLVKQTEKTVIEGYQTIEKKEQEAAEASVVAEPTTEQQPIVKTIPATVVVAQGEPTQNINVPIPVSLHQQLKIYAAQTKQNMKDLVVLAIKEYMDHQKSPEL